MEDGANGSAASVPSRDSAAGVAVTPGLYKHAMSFSLTVIAKLRPDREVDTWGLFIPAEDRWVDVLFHRELDARRFAKRLMQEPPAA